MKKIARVKYIWEGTTKFVTFNGVKENIKKDEVKECSEKNARNVCKMYPRLFKKTDKPEVKARKGWDKAKKTVEKKKVTKKVLPKKK